MRPCRAWSNPARANSRTVAQSLAPTRTFNQPFSRSVSISSKVRLSVLRAAAYPSSYAGRTAAEVARRTEAAIRSTDAPGRAMATVPTKPPDRGCEAAHLHGAAYIRAAL